jgi:hypothetical protein
MKLGTSALSRRVGRTTPTVWLLFSMSSAAIAQDRDHHDHDHEGLHFSHPIVSESPSPDTKVRIDYGFTDITEDDEGLSQNGVRLEAESAFHPSFSIELDVPYRWQSHTTAATESSLDNVSIGLKFANFAFAQSGVLLGYGIEFGLPTGDSEKGIGSDHIVEFVPFLDFGYKRSRLELVSFVEFAIPTNQSADEEIETELEYTFSSLYHFGARLQGLVEFDGETVLSGEEAGETVFNLSPGLKYRFLRSRMLAFGVSAGLPLTDHREFDVRVLASVFYHF